MFPDYGRSTIQVQATSEDNGNIAFKMEGETEVFTWERTKKANLKEYDVVGHIIEREFAIKMRDALTAALEATE